MSHQMVLHLTFLDHDNHESRKEPQCWIKDLPNMLNKLSLARLVIGDMLHLQTQKRIGQAKSALVQGKFECNVQRLVHARTLQDTSCSMQHDSEQIFADSSTDTDRILQNDRLIGHSCGCSY